MKLQELESTARHNDVLLSEAKRRVLLVEDDPEMRAMVRASLVRNGFDVNELMDGSSALEYLGSTLLERPSAPRPDVIVTDNRMPHFDGLDLLHTLRLMREPIPLIMITAFGDPALHRAVAEHPDAIVLDKPFDLDVLVRRVKAASGPGLFEPAARHCRKRRRGPRPERGRRRGPMN